METSKGNTYLAFFISPDRVPCDWLNNDSWWSATAKRKEKS